ncbi:MAG: hypothetical protein RR292_06315 [Christensenellaceae bacterium]
MKLKKFTEKQMKVVQIILGFIAGGAIWLSIGLGALSDTFIFQYMFLIVFVATFIIRRAVERKFEVNTNVFSKFYLIGLIVFLGIYLLYGWANGLFTR